MDAQQAIAKLERQKLAIKDVVNKDTSAPEFTKWRRDTEIAIERIFGPQSRNVADFEAIGYSPQVLTTSSPDSVWSDSFHRGLAKADAVLASMIDEIREYGDAESDAGTPDVLSLIERICLGFNRAARQLQARHADRTAMAIDDEYDVQDLMHALPLVHFDDVRREETTPSSAGAGARVDFLLKKEQIVVEVKKTRPSLKAKELGEQLIVDRARYEKHPDCKTLVCFVYDPECRIGNPVGIERDLEDHGGPLKVRVIIAPKN